MSHSQGSQPYLVGFLNFNTWLPNHTRTCDSDRLWSGGQPECVEINCGWPNNGLFPNGWFEGSRTNLNAVITFRCHEGMKFEGEKQQATCRADGKVDTS